MATARKITKLASINLAQTPHTAASKKRIIKSSKRLVDDSAVLMSEGKRLVKNLYKDGNQIIQHASNDVKAYSEDMLKKVHKNPVTSLLVATGLGMVLSLILRGRK